MDSLVTIAARALAAGDPPRKGRRDLVTPPVALGANTQIGNRAIDADV
jgi:hypothetical protein